MMTKEQKRTINKLNKDSVMINRKYTDLLRTDREAAEVYRLELVAIEEEISRIKMNIDLEIWSSDKRQSAINEYIVNDRIDTMNTFEAYYDEEMIELLKVFLQIANDNNYKISESPSSSSMYALPVDEEITWGYKPENSYRLANHWNWGKEDDKHCPTNTNECLGLTIAQFNNGVYAEI